MDTINLLYRNLFYKHALKLLNCIHLCKIKSQKAETMRSILIHTYAEASHLWNLFTIWKYHIWRSKARCAVDLTSALNLLFTYSASSWYVPIAFHSSNFNCIWLSLQFFNVYSFFLLLYFSRKNSLVVRTQLSVRVHAIIGK
jgi:hypothetical protein